ncbi:MAG: DUF4012 domain-containing protein, partial [Actinomycetota bacterium]|nr:DUF4012 domain-containing protein [Actinomycetota bacterium]
ACVAFLAFNLRPALIFMGDAGSMFLGAAVASLTLAGHPPGPASVRAVVPVLIIGLPLLDTVTVALGRARRRISVLQGGRDHLSHRLVAAGMRRRTAVRTLLLAEGVSVAAAVAVARGMIGPWLGLLIAAVPLAIAWLRTSRVRVYHDPVVGLPRSARWAVAGGGLLIIVVSAPAALAMARARIPLEVAGSAAQAGIQHAQSGDTAAANQDFIRAGASFATARDRLSALGVSAGRVVPVVAVNLRAATALAQVGADLSRSGQELATGTDVQGLRIQQGAVPLNTLSQLTPRLVSLSAQLTDASKRVHRLPRTLLVAPLRRAVGQLDAKLATVARQARQSADAASMVPGLLGSNGQRRYLLMFQNSAEARATGGLIGNFGELVAQSGRIAQGHFGRLEELNAPAGAHRSVAAPADYLARYSRFSPFDLWQNINLSPDFPTVGAVAARLYPQSGGSPVAGVVAVDPIALSDLLRLTGPIQVSRWPTPITAENVIQVTLQGAYDALPYDRRVAFLGDVAQAVFAAATSRDLGNPLRIAQALGPAVAHRHLQLYLTDKAEEAFAARLGAAGAFVPAAGDQFLVTTQNASANKVDYYLQRKLSYRLALKPPGSNSRSDDRAHVHGTLTVDLTNNAPASGHALDALGPYLPTLTAGENRTFLSLYTPLVVSSGVVDGRPAALASGSELGQHVYSLFLDIPAGATRTVTFLVEGSIRIAPGGWYTLDLPHQPTLGTDQVDISLTVPHGWQVQAGPASSRWVRRYDAVANVNGPIGVRLQMRQTGLLNLLAPIASTTTPVTP